MLRIFMDLSVLFFPSFVSISAFACVFKSKVHCVSAVRFGCALPGFPMMMIVFIIIKSSLVTLIEGLCAQIYFRFEMSVVVLASSSFQFGGRNNMFKENKKAVSPDFCL